MKLLYACAPRAAAGASRRGRCASATVLPRVKGCHRAPKGAAARQNDAAARHKGDAARRKGAAARQKGAARTPKGCRAKRGAAKGQAKRMCTLQDSNLRILRYYDLNVAP